MNGWIEQLWTWRAAVEPYLQTALTRFEEVPRWAFARLLVLILLGWSRTYRRARKLAAALVREAEETSSWQARYDREKMWRDASSAVSTNSNVALPRQAASRALTRRAREAGSRRRLGPACRAIRIRRAETQ